jgi:tripartite ATP-independent transporter DctP family solute receptor
MARILRSRRPTLIVAGLLILSIALVGPATGQQTYSFRMAFQTGDPDTPVYVTATKFKQSVEQRSNGRIKVQLFPGGVLGDQLALVSGVRTGAIDMGIMVAWSLATVEPSLMLPDLPFLFQDVKAARKVLDGPAGKKVLSYLEPKGIKGLAWCELGLRGVISNKRIQTPADVKGLKIRVVENPLYIATWRAAGANPVPMAFGEIYLALKQGALDAVDTNYEAFYGAKHYEVAKYLAETDHMYTAAVIGINLPKFSAVPPELQKAMLDAAEDAKQESWAKAQDIEQRAKRVIGQHVKEVTRPDAAAFREAMKKVYKDWEPAIGKDLLDQTSSQ